jgi:phosphomevalonate kinase
VTRARAPGKVVLSGAYAVLSGAPAIVSAVSRYVLADTDRPAPLLTDEVRAALIAGQQAPWFDASALREHDRKLGLGSSAAILVASLFALERAARPSASAAELRELVFARALTAHRAAQGGGSGVDVASSTFGGSLVYRLGDGAPRITPVALPAQLRFEIWVCPSSASTPRLIAQVEALRARDPAGHARFLGAQADASHAAAACAEQGDAAGLLQALRAQFAALSGLGHAAKVPIVTPELAELGPAAEGEGGLLLPAGAGGGDIALYVGPRPSSAALRAALQRRTHVLLDADIAAGGVSEA